MATMLFSIHLLKLNSYEPRLYMYCAFVPAVGLGEGALEPEARMTIELTLRRSVQGSYQYSTK